MDTDVEKHSEIWVSYCNRLQAHTRCPATRLRSGRGEGDKLVIQSMLVNTTFLTIVVESQGKLMDKNRESAVKIDISDPHMV